MITDEEYHEIMLEAYRDVLSKLIYGYEIPGIHEYVLEQIKNHNEAIACQ